VGIPKPAQTVALFKDPHNPTLATAALNITWDGTTACLVVGIPNPTPTSWMAYGRVSCGHDCCGCTQVQ
jgi:hypothetical protein